MAFPAGSYMPKVNNRNTTASCEISSKLTYFTTCSSVSIVNFEQVNASWVVFAIRGKKNHSSKLR